MVSFLILLSFFAYSFVLFFITDIKILLFLFIFNIIMGFIFRVNNFKRVKFLLKNIIFVIFIFLCNLLFESFFSSFLISLRLFLIIDYTYIIGYYFDSSKIREALRILFWPLKIFRINIDDLSLILAIALTFIPILTNDARVIRIALKNKGFDFSLKNLFRRPQIFLMTYVNNLFDRIDEIEKALMLKGY